MAVAQFSDGNYRWIGVHNGAWTGEEEMTSLLSKYHASANGLWVDDTHKAHGGSQCISVQLKDGSYDEIALVPYNRLLTFPLETYSVEDIIEGMSEDELGEVFPDYDQIVWMDRDESVQELMEDDEDAKAMAQKSSGAVRSEDLASEDSIGQGDMSTTESDREIGQNEPSEDGLSEQEMYEMLVHHATLPL